MKQYIIISLVICLIVFPSKIFSQTDKELAFKIDSIDNLVDDTNKVNTYNNLIWQISYFDSANSVSCAEKSIKLAAELGYFKGIATAQKNLAAYYYYHGNYQEALDLYELSLKNYSKAGYKKGLSFAYRNLGNVYSQIGSWETALTNYFESLKLREEIKDTVGKAKTLSSIGILFSSVPGHEDSSLVYLNRALDIFIQVDDKYNISSTYLGISGLYYNMSIKSFSKQKKQDSILGYNFRDSSVYYSKLAIEESSQIGIKRIEASAYQAIGFAYLDAKMFDSAYVCLYKSLEIRKEDNNTFGIVNSLNSIGNYYYKIKDYNNSLIYLKEALDLSQKIKTDQVSSEIMSLLAEVYYYQKNYKLAFEYYDGHSKLKDSLYNDSKTKEMTQLSMQYEFDKKQKMQELEQQKKDAIQEAKIKRQKLVSSFFIVGFIMLLFVVFLIFKSYKQKTKINKILKDKNNEITLKNTQLNQSNAEIAAQRDEIDRQKIYLEKQNKEITASINYARRIQRALLTPIELLEQHLDDFFILYKPRDIVSGDYFWASKIGDKLVITAADCTGHGVPGAFMSMLGISFLNQIVNQDYINRPQEITAADILDKMRYMVVNSLSHGSEDENNPQEGMDMALSIIDKKNKKINFAGAYNPLILVRDNELTIIKPDKMPVGYHYIKKASNFTNKYIDYKPEDRIYMFSDGLQDQFGGETGKKFTPKKMRQMFLDNYKLPMKKQYDLYEEIFQNWVNTEEKQYRQLDDILVMGIKL